MGGELVLEITKEDRERARTITRWANWLPDDHRKLAGQFGVYNARYSHAWNMERLYRHLSIFNTSPDRPGRVVAAFYLAEMFGFSGWDRVTIDEAPASWDISIDSDNVFEISQEMKQ